MVGIPTFNGSWPWPWIGSNCILSCITHWPLLTHQISLKSKTVFVDGRTDVHTYRRTFETHLIRSTLLSRPNKANSFLHMQQIPNEKVSIIVSVCCRQNQWKWTSYLQSLNRIHQMLVSQTLDYITTHKTRWNQEDFINKVLTADVYKQWLWCTVVWTNQNIGDWTVSAERS